MTETPINPIVFDGYGVAWGVTSGSPDVEVRLGDFLPGMGEETLQPNYFNTKFKWDSVELKYSAFEDDYEPMGRFNVEAKVFGYIKKQNDDGIETTEIYDIPYKLESLTITSEDPNDGGTWIYPDDYDVEVDPKHPKQYGGVIMRDGFNREYFAGQKCSCGLEDGPNNDAIVPWINSNSRLEQAISAYNYIDVFDETQFSYIPRNSDEFVSLADNEKFLLTPLYPDVLDENGKHAPIYPMNTLTNFSPDGRDTVTVTYNVSLKVSFTVGLNKGVLIPVDNPEAVVKQICVQNNTDYAQQMEQIIQYCNWSNPGGYTPEELAPDYPRLYPYTLVNGFDGLGVGQTPVTRGDDKNNESLERGDVWYNPDTEERKYYTISDVPSELEVTEGGGGYKDREGVMCVWMPTQDRCFDLRKIESAPFGLMCDIKTENGQVVSATISDTGTPTGWSDGDIVAVTGGKNNARLKVTIKDEPGWIDNYVEVI